MSSDVEQRLADAIAREQLERKIRGVYLSALNDIASRTGDERTLRIIKTALDKGSALRLDARSAGIEIS